MFSNILTVFNEYLSLLLHVINLNLEKSTFIPLYHTHRVLLTSKLFHHFTWWFRVWKFPRYYYYSALWNQLQPGKHVVFRSRCNHPRQYVLICQNYNAASIIYEGKDTSRRETHRLGLCIRRDDLSIPA